MRTIKLLTIGILSGLVILGIFSFLPLIENSPQDTGSFEEYISDTHKLSTSTSTNPINISSSSDWALYPFITGNGSESNPYVIKDVEIQGSGVKTETQGTTLTRINLNFSYCGIYINSGEHVLIQDCVISDFSIGITFGLGANVTQINNVTIDSCGLGIYNWVLNVHISITQCHISNCVLVDTSELYNPGASIYGGYGIWVKFNHGSSLVDNNYIQDCSFGILCSGMSPVTRNELVNCGFFFDMSTIYITSPYIAADNLVNGKPFKLFIDEEGLRITQDDADLYGQMMFVQCDDLKITNIGINEACSIGLYITLVRMDPIGIELSKINVKNQLIGIYFNRGPFDCSRITVENCEIGTMLGIIRDCEFSQMVYTGCTIPIYCYSSIRDTTIQIEKEIPFFILDLGAQLEGLHFESPKNNFDLGGVGTYEYLFQLNDTELYHVTNYSESYPVMDFYIDVKQNFIPAYNIIILIGSIAISISLLSKKYQAK